MVMENEKRVKKSKKRGQSHFLKKKGSESFFNKKSNKKRGQNHFLAVFNATEVSNESLTLKEKEVRI